jgi:hypothetical protein
LKNKKVVAKVIIILLIIILNLFIIHLIIDCSISKEYIYRNDSIRVFNAQFRYYEGNDLSGSMIKALISTVESNNAIQNEKVELIKAYEKLSAREKYNVKLEYSKDTFLVCRIIISSSNNSKTYISPTSEETFTTEEVNVFFENHKDETKITVDYEELRKQILQYLPFLICYILLLINIIIAKESKQIWLCMALITIIFIVYIWFFHIASGYTMMVPVKI